MFDVPEDLDRAIRSLTSRTPEIILVVTAVVVLLSSFSKKLSGATRWIALAGVVIHLVVVWSDLKLGYFFELLAAIAAIVTILMSREQKMEYYLLVLSILLGADLMITSGEFIIIILAMELVSIPSYVLTAGSNPDKRRAEAAWKFFLYGSTATATMIFGMSYLFGATGSATLEGNFVGDPVMISVGGLMMLAGLFFKMSAAPFHLWAPDVYEATPSPIVAYLSVVPKFAALVVVLRFVSALPVDTIDWTAVIAGFAMLSIVVGTLAALAQKDAKRMMAYSTVAQSGFLLAALASFTPGSGDAIYAIGFYALVFLVMNYLVFMVIQIKEENGGSVLYEDFAGLGYRAVVPAVAITIAFISLTGLPPVAGFTAKLLVFSVLWAKFSATHGFIFMALFVIGLLATVVSLFFYLKIPFFMFFRESGQKEPLKISRFTNLLLLFLVGLLFALFLFPGLFDWLGGWVIKVNFVL